MESITIDGQGEEDFRRSIEAMLRRGQADAAAARLRALIEPYAGSILPARFLTVASADVVLAGWSDLAHRIGEHDRPGHRVSALEITADDGNTRTGQPSPHVETRYFSDETYPFSEASRRDLLRGYGSGDSAWQGHPEGSDTALSLQGIDDLRDAVARLETQLMNNPEPGEHDIRAGSLGACYLAVLFHQAVEDAIARGGLPRPLCVLAGTGDAYPYFEAPVVTGPECREAGLGASVPIALPPALAEALDVEDDEEEEEEEEENDEDQKQDGQSGRAQSYGSLLSLGASIRVKKPVITVDATEAAAATHHYELGAQHRLTIAGNSDRIGVLPELAPADQPENASAAAGEEWNEPEAVDALADAFLGQHTEPGDGLQHQPPSVAEEPASEDMPEAADDMAGAARANVPEHDESVIAAAESTLDEEAVASETPPLHRVVPAPAAHSLRSRVVRQQSQSITLRDRIVVFLQRAGRWLDGFRR